MRMLSSREEMKEEDVTLMTDLSVPNDYSKGPAPRRLSVFVSLAAGHSLAPLPQPLPKEMRREVVVPKRDTPRTITLVTSTVPTIPYRQPPPPPPPTGPKVAIPARSAYPIPVPAHAYPPHVYDNRNNDMRYYGEYIDPYGQNYDLSPTSVAAPEIALFNPVPCAPLCGHNYDLSPMTSTTISASISFDEECAILGISCCIYIYMV